LIDSGESKLGNSAWAEMLRPPLAREPLISGVGI